jgi:hypothetical protein
MSAPPVEAARDQGPVWISFAQFHAWIMALFYPAVLGTALMAWLSPAASGAPERIDTQWAPVLIAYFALQYGEGLGRHRDYDSGAMLADIAEIFAVLAAFDLMNILDVGFMEWAPGLTLGRVLLIVFLIPVIIRFGRLILRVPTDGFKRSVLDGWPRPVFLSVMSCIAGLVALAAPGSIWAAGLVSGVLGVYFVIFIPLKSPRVPDAWNALRREPPSAV